MYVNVQASLTRVHVRIIHVLVHLLFLVWEASTKVNTVHVCRMCYRLLYVQTACWWIPIKDLGGGPDVSVLAGPSTNAFEEGPARIHVAPVTFWNLNFVLFTEQAVSNMFLYFKTNQSKMPSALPQGAPHNLTTLVRKYRILCWIRSRFLFGFRRLHSRPCIQWGRTTFLSN